MPETKLAHIRALVQVDKCQKCQNVPPNYYITELKEETPISLVLCASCLCDLSRDAQLIRQRN